FDHDDVLGVLSMDLRFNVKMVNVMIEDSYLGRSGKLKI
ncbi:hypothetical protein Tco_1269077, partial [Tanacetum coccineum]